MPAEPALFPLWADGGEADRSARPSATGLIEADVVIVGAGFTGLWTAAHLLEQRPGRRVVVVESERVGFGASGRNGGWCSTALPTGWDAIARRHGPVRARQTFAAMADTVDRIGQFATRHHLDIGYRKGGYLHVARTDAQQRRLEAEHREASAVGDESAWLDARGVSERIAVAGALAGTFTPNCAAVHPGRLVRGLARVVEAAGGVIHEGSRVRSVSPRSVEGTGFRIAAPVVVTATEAYTAALPGRRRTLAPVYSLMIATEPLPAEVWDEIGWRERETFNDARRLIVYAQRTADDRIAFGGRGAPYHFGSRIDPRFDHDAGVHDALARALVELLPAAAGAAITHRWGGPLGVARDWEASASFDPLTGMGRAGGYVGDGVASSHLAGRTLAALIDGIDDPVVRLPWVGHRSPVWEPEPLRWFAATSMLRLTERIDRREAQGRRAPFASRLLDRVTGG